MSAREDVSMLPIDRATALAIGASHFYSGVPCRRRHLSKRTALRDTCLECNTGIGKFGDNPQLIERAANYVRNKGELNCPQV